WDALEYHEEWRVYKYPMNKGKLTTALYKQLDWFKNEGSEEEKKSAERMLNQFKVRPRFCELYDGCGRKHGGLRFLPMYGLRFHPVAKQTTRLRLLSGDGLRFRRNPFMNLQECIDGCIHDFWIKAMAERQASLKELKVDAEVRGLKAEQRLTIATVATKQVEEYALSTTLDVHTEQRIEKRPLYTEPTTDDEEFDEESMFFEPSNITKIQEIVAETIERTIDDGWEVKLLKWQQHALKQLINGVQYPSEQSIYNILCASSIFYFQQERRPTYTGFLTTNEIADIRSHVLSKFEIIEIPDRVKEYVKENKK
ncbi:3239_t:CDS:2, partial [Ambispora gerdemannii]